MRLFICIFCLLLFSCNPEKHLAHFIKRHPELVKSDTVWKRDTIWTKLVQKDTSFYFAAPDTVFINQGKLQVKYYYNRHDSTIYLQGKCKPDTVIKLYAQAINNTNVKPPALGWGDKIKLWLWDNGWWIALLIFVIWKLFGRVIKKVIGVYFPFL